mgnify:CR=1 FL=1
MKYCPQCKMIKEDIDFNKNRSTKSGLSDWCKICNRISSNNRRKNNVEKIRLYAKQYYIKNKDKINEKGRAYKHKNKDKVKAYAKAYMIKNKEILLIKDRIWKANNREKVNKRAAKYRKENNISSSTWRHNNPEKAKQWDKNWRLKNKNRLNEYERLRYALPMNKINGSISANMRQSLHSKKQGKHWETLVNYTLTDLINHLEKQFIEDMSWDNYGKWHIDHIIPISLWKFNTPEDREFEQCWGLCNLQPLWGYINMRKQNKTSVGLRWGELKEI